MLKIIKFDSFKKGNNILILGAIHGNETCGVEAIKKIIKKIENNKIVLNSGSITFIPICNLEAYKNNIRYFEKNLNRVIKKHNNPTYYEEHVANSIIEYIRKSDYLLDLHSMHENGSPFVFQDHYDTKNRNDFVKSLGLKYIFRGWPDIYKDCIIEDCSTEKFAFENNVIASTVECGSHIDKKSIKVAENTILNAFDFLKIIKTRNKKINTNNIIVYMKKVFIKNFEGKLNFNHLDKIKKNDIIVESFDKHKKIIADNDYVMILPNNKANINEEWFYLGKYE